MKAEQENEEVYAIPQLSKDMRRMLTVQFKEFVNHIEDSEGIGIERSHSLRSVAWISYYDRYKIA